MLFYFALSAPRNSILMNRAHIEKAWELLNITTLRLWTALAKVIDNSPCLMRYI
jgi:hypothetical protein